MSTKSGKKSRRSSDFLDSEVGNSLLNLVSRGNAITAELQRLGQSIPECFISEVAEPRFKPVIYGLDYLRASETIEARIEESDELTEIDEEFQELYQPLLNRVFLLLQSIANYYEDLNTFIEDLADGKFIQFTMDSILTQPDGLQLMVESVWLWGVMLYLLVQLMPGMAREKLIVSYIRSRGQVEISNIDAICSLCRAFVPPPVPEPKKNRRAKKEPEAPGPFGYEEFFSRFPLEEFLVNTMIARLRSEDIYNMGQHFPLPEQRSCALSAQAGVTVVLLWFVPETLKNDNLVMREICDKFFSDQWVVPIYLGFAVDVVEIWQYYAAARTCLVTHYTIETAQNLYMKNLSSIRTLQGEMKELLVDGVITTSMALNEGSRLMTVIRSSNVSLRWLLLHCLMTSVPYLRQIVIVDDNADKIMELVGSLLDVAQLEFFLKTSLEQLMEAREAQWERSKNLLSLGMQELSKFFAGTTVMAKEIRDAGLEKWFKKMADKVSSLELGDASSGDQELSSTQISNGRKLYNLCKALDEVLQFHQIDSSPQAKTVLQACRDELVSMAKTLEIKGQSLTTLSIVADGSYALRCVSRFIPSFHNLIQNDPQSLARFRCLLVKLKSIMDTPLLRIAQSGSGDLLSVTQFYSSELANLAGRILEVIPMKIMDILQEIANLKEKAQGLKAPTRIEKKNLKDFAVLDVRSELSKATARLAALTRGILAMEKTFVGVIELDPSKILNDGIRKHLVKRFTELLDFYLRFDGSIFFGMTQDNRIRQKLQKAQVTSSKMFEDMVSTLVPPEYLSSETGAISGIGDTLVEMLLRLVSRRLNTLQDTLTYAQDYVNIYALRLWQEEFHRVIMFHVQQEVNKYVKNKVRPSESIYQSSSIPIPFSGNKNGNFMTRIVDELQRLTDPQGTLYIYQLSGWYGPQGDETVTMRTISLLQNALGNPGLTGVDQTLCFRQASRIANFVNYFDKSVDPQTLSMIFSFRQNIHPFRSNPRLSNNLPFTPAAYDEILGPVSRYSPLLITSLAWIGQIQLLRRHIATELSSNCGLNSEILARASAVASQAVMADIRANYELGNAVDDDDNKKFPYPKEENRLLESLAKSLAAIGLHDPLAKIYTTAAAGSSTQVQKIIPLIGFLLILIQIKQLAYDRHLKSVTPSDARSHLFHPKLKLVKRDQQYNHLSGQIPVHEGPPDPFAFMVGLLTVLRQFHVDILREFLEIVGQYIRVHMLHATSGASEQGRNQRAEREPDIEGYEFLNRNMPDGGAGKNRRNTPQDQSATGTKANVMGAEFRAASMSDDRRIRYQLPKDVVTMLMILESMTQIGKLPRDLLAAHIPTYILDLGL